MKTINLDKTDRRILSLLQDDATLTIKDLAEQVHLSTTPCWKRVQRLQQSGLIRKQVALLDNQQLGLGLTVFVAIRTNQHNIDWSNQFASTVQAMPEIVEVYRLSGDVDYILKAIVADTRAYDELYKKIIGQVDLFDVSSMFAMEEIKNTTALPV